MPLPAFLGFLRYELSPVPGRIRATLRPLIASLVAIILIMTFQLTEGHLIILQIFVVSQPVAIVSLNEAFWRLIGVGAGGILAIVAMISSVDAPWFFIPLVAVIITVTMFLSRITTKPVAVVLAGFTFVLAALPQAFGSDYNSSLILWSMLLLSLGVILGMGAQLLLWPDKPEELLVNDLVTRLTTAERLIDHALEVTDATRERVTGTVWTEFSGGGLSRALDLLGSAVALSPTSQRNQLELTVLITEVDRLVTAAQWLKQGQSQLSRSAVLSDPTRMRLMEVKTKCAQLRRTIESREPATLSDGEGPAVLRLGIAQGAAVEHLAALNHMEQALDGIEAAIRSLIASRHRALENPAKGGAPTLSRSVGKFSIQAFSLTQKDAIKFGLKCALAVEVTYLIMLGTHWQDIVIGAALCLMAANANAGASLKMLLLYLSGAFLGGVLGMIVILFVVPNLGSVESLLLLSCIGFGIAAWITVGSSRISYAGVQAAVAFGVVIADSLAPTTNFLPARDRFLGIILGTTVMGVIVAMIWPVYASRAMRHTLAGIFRSMVSLFGPTPAEHHDARHLGHFDQVRRAVNEGCVATLRLIEEAGLEPGGWAQRAQAKRDAILYATADAERLYFALVALLRTSSDVPPRHLAVSADQSTTQSHSTLAKAVAGLADLLDGIGTQSVAKVRSQIEIFNRLVADELTFRPTKGSNPVARILGQERITVYRELMECLVHVEEITK